MPLPALQRADLMNSVGLNVVDEVTQFNGALIALKCNILGAAVVVVGRDKNQKKIYLQSVFFFFQELLGGLDLQTTRHLFPAQTCGLDRFQMRAIQ